MFMPWGDRPTDRHRAFMDPSSLHSYLVQRFPHSCFHSTAYYDDPSQRTMADKGWRGADLIFDLDGDHLHGISYTDFPGLMHSIQEQAWSLWNDFLEPEFGFKREYAQFTFSGHRGFHIHLGTLHCSTWTQTQGGKSSPTYEVLALKYPRLRPTIRGGRDVWTKASKEYRICFRRHRRKNQIRPRFLP